jgi:Domain of unknown function (DUF4157)
MNRALTPQTAMKTTPASVGYVLQRKCTCGSHTVAGGTCEECSKQTARLQRNVDGLAASTEAPPIVHQVLQSPGKAVDPNTRAFMESRFGHDFSRVRVHTDAEAAASALEVDALAYTVGHDVVFGQGQYAPHTTSGRRLIAHELTHTIQQSHGAESLQGLRIDHASSSSEREAAHTANAVMSGRPRHITHGGVVLARQTPAPSVQQPSNLPTVTTYEGVTPTWSPAHICARPLRTPGLSLLFSHAYVVSPPATYAIIQPMCTPTDGGPNDFQDGTAGRKWDNSLDPCGATPECVPCQPKAGVSDVQQCLRNAFNAYNSPTMLKAWGPNSNTFAGTLARKCCAGITSSPFKTAFTPGWNDPPAPSRSAKCEGSSPICS